MENTFLYLYPVNIPIACIFLTEFPKRRGLFISPVCFFDKISKTKPGRKASINKNRKRKKVAPYHNLFASQKRMSHPFLNLEHDAITGRKMKANQISLSTSTITYSIMNPWSKGPQSNPTKLRESFRGLRKSIKVGFALRSVQNSEHWRVGSQIEILFLFIQIVR